MLSGENEILGTAPSLAAGESLWLLLEAPGAGVFYIENRDGPIVPDADGSWRQEIGLNVREPGDFRLYAVIVDARDGQTLKDQESQGASPYVDELPASVDARKVSMNVACCH